MSNSAAHLRPPRERQALVGAAVVVVLLLVLTQLLGACEPDDPRLSAPTPEQLARPTSLPSTTAPTSPSTLESVPASDGAAQGVTTVAVAKADVTEVVAYDGPGSATVKYTVTSPGEYQNPQVFVVVEQQGDWLHVQLPIRPNGAQGWIRAADVELTQHDYRIDVSLSGFKLWVRKGTETLLEAPIGVGTSDTPTPATTYYTWVLLMPTNEDAYGAYAYGLSGFSETLETFQGGDARLGIHGTNDESTIGTNVSHGCIRVSDETVTTMVEQIGLPLGVPVSVAA